MRILLAEQNVLTAQVTSKALTAAGFIVDYHDRGDDAFEMARCFEYDVALLDMALPGISGLEVLRQLRRTRRDMPVVILTSNTDPRGKTEAFGAGADDVVALPVDHAELVARLHAIIRRSRGLDNPTIRIGCLDVNFNTMEVNCGNQPVHLTGKEFAILQLLILRRGTVLTKDAFLNHLYGGMDEPETKIIDVFVCKLRKKLQMAGVTDLIVTVWGRGYMLRENRAKQVPPQAMPAALPHTRHYATA
jgi:two-component system cell cycle response regulator CtrA